MVSFTSPVSSTSELNSSDPDHELLDTVLSSLRHLDIRDEVDDLEITDLSGASSDVFSGYWQDGINRIRVAVKKIRIHCKKELDAVKVRSQ